MSDDIAMCAYHVGQWNEIVRANDAGRLRESEANYELALITNETSKCKECRQ